MKKHILSVYALLLLIFLSSCNKEAQMIKETGYGTLTINAKTSIETLLVEVDGKLVDTLNQSSSANLDLKTYAGDRKLKIYEPGKIGNPVFDTVLIVPLGKTVNFNFLYTGELKIVGGGADDSIVPPTGKSLIQFVNMSSSLPSFIDITIFEAYDDGTGNILTHNVAEVKRVTKNAFSQYIEFGPESHVTPPETSYGYYFEVFDSSNGNKLVDFMTEFPGISWGFGAVPGSVSFMPGRVLSLGIAISPDTGLHTTSVIYEKQSEN